MFSFIKKSSRLGQWNSRRRTSGDDERVLARLGQMSVLLRLAAVGATMLVVAFLAYRAGPPVPYRVGEIYATHLLVRAPFEVVNQPRTDQARAAAIKEQLSADEVANPVTRERAAQAVAPVVDRYETGTALVRRGQPISDAQLILLKEEHRAYLASLSPWDRARRGTALLLIMSQLAVIVVLYALRFQPALAQSLGKVGGVCLVVVLTVGLGVVLSGPPWYAVLVPLTVTAMILTIAYNPQFALLMSFCLALAATVALGSNLQRLLIEMAGLATAILLLRNVRTRTLLVRVGLGAGLAYLAMTVAT